MEIGGKKQYKMEKPPMEEWFVYHIWKRGRIEWDETALKYALHFTCLALTVYYTIFNLVSCYTDQIFLSSDVTI